MPPSGHMSNLRSGQKQPTEEDCSCDRNQLMKLFEPDDDEDGPSTIGSVKQIVTEWGNKHSLYVVGQTDCQAFSAGMIRSLTSCSDMHAKQNSVKRGFAAGLCQHVLKPLGAFPWIYFLGFFFAVSL